MSEVPQIKVTEPEPSDENPWLDDKLGRKDCASKLTAVIQGQIAPMTISVNGEWGSGKTFMLKRWQKQLEKEGYTAIYFNAWEDDCLADPLVAILGQLYKDLNKGTLKNVCEAVKNATGPFLKRVGLSMLNKGVEHLTGVDAAGIIAEELKTAQESALDNYVAMTESRTTLKDALQDLANKNFEEKKTPLVFIIDELDRCRPTFAIEVLERIKHLFNIDHVIFVLGIDRKNLGKSIQSVYGEVDVENYLHRFFDFDFRLSDAEPKKFIQVMWNRYKIGVRLETLSKNDARRYEDDGLAFLKMIIPLFLLHRFTLREIEQSIKLYALALKDEASVLRIYPVLLPVFIVLKLRNLDLYRKYINFECPPNEIIDFLIPSLRAEITREMLSVAALVYATYLLDRKYREGIVALITTITNKAPLLMDPIVADCVKMCSLSERQIFAYKIDEFDMRYDQNSLHLINEKLNLFNFILER